MAQITIPAARLHLAADPTENIEVGWTQLSGQEAPRGEVRMLADGSKRAVEWPGIDESIEPDIPFTLYSDVAKVRGWFGRAVVWRDAEGQGEVVSHQPDRYR